MRKLSIIILLFFLISVFFTSCKSQPQLPLPVQKIAAKILEPEFVVRSIYIIQADIVVTEFEAVIRVTNPNDFAMELSSIVYELFGSGRFWSGGTANDILRIPANSSGETSFRFQMNFIDMNRRLLDDVIAMRRVNYIFKGKAQVRPVIGDISPFFVDFNCTGYSEVKEK